MSKNVVNFMQSFNKGNPCSSNKHMHDVLRILSRQIGPNDLLIHDGWLTKDYVKRIRNFYKRSNIKNIYYISLVDEFTMNSKEAEKEFSSICDKVVYAGNTLPTSKTFYSFWIDFVYSYRQNFFNI